MNWQPIETAPKDGTRILLLRARKRIVVGQWDDDRYATKPRPFWIDDSYRTLGRLEMRADIPAGWMPLPEPPAT